MFCTHFFLGILFKELILSCCFFNYKSQQVDPISEMAVTILGSCSSDSAQRRIKNYKIKFKTIYLCNPSKGQFSKSYQQP